MWKDEQLAVTTQCSTGPMHWYWDDQNIIWNHEQRVAASIRGCAVVKRAFRLLRSLEFGANSPADRKTQLNAMIEIGVAAPSPSMPTQALECYIPAT
jgi:hypothetical protein